MTQPDPTHEISPSNTYWTTVNTAEAMPGVMTALSWTAFWDEPLETAMRSALVDMGALRRSERRYPDDCGDRFTGIFHGRVAANVDLYCLVGDRMPGTSGEAVELQLFGHARPDAPRHPTVRRYPVVATRMPVVMARLPRWLARERREADRWWRESVFGSAPDPAGARSLFVDARNRFRTYMRAHVAAGFLCQGAYDQVAQTAAALGHPGLETTLVRGYGGMEETAVAADLWRVSRGDQTMEEFVRRHGYHGPHEGELSSRSWRESTGPVVSLANRYLGMGEDGDPHLVEQRCIRDRAISEAELLDGVGGVKRLQARLVLRMARRHVAGREVGKASFLQAMDVGRFAARIVGVDLASRGVLREADDVFSLTLDELLNADLVDVMDRVEQRQALRLERQGGRLPDTWTGNPTMLSTGAAQDDVDVIAGIAASAGTYEGIARVITDPSTADLEDGEILVCSVTDPSWAALFVVAGAVVTDIGGPISHGAIVAREMGLPAVVNTRIGTRVIRDGDRIRVDGAAGTVEVLDRAAQVTQDA